MTITDRLNQARQSGKSAKDVQLLSDQDARRHAEVTEAADDFEAKLARQKAQRAARDAAIPAKAPAGSKKR